ncbi:hypothetical protein HHI36_018328, partial [Cryptolaemus montrouzieri]
MPNSADDSADRENALVAALQNALSVNRVRGRYTPNYGECRKNSRRATELYAERFPNRDEVPNHYFFRLERQFRRLPVQPHDHFIMDEPTETNVLAMVEIDFTISLIQIVNETGMPKETAQ